MLETIRTAIPASYRAQAYAIGAALVALLTTYGALDESTAPAVAGMVVAVITLAFAALHSTSPLRTSVYGVTAAFAVMAVAFGWASEDQTTAMLGVVAPVLGLGVAAANTNPEQPQVEFGNYNAPYASE